jgi:uncharacterized protein involved in cysteine biosynthesis
MLTALLKACGDLFTPAIFAILARSLAIAVVIFVALAFLLGWALTGSDPCDWVGLDSCPLGGAAGSLGGILFAVLGFWLLFPAVALGVLAAYAEDVVAAVEARHYPEGVPSVRRLGLGGMALLGLRSSARLLLVNLVALPFYLLLLITGVGPVILFVLVNGWAAGRDFGEMVAYPRGDAEARRRWLRATRATRTGIGVACACLFLVPFLNLLAPVIGAAAVTHLYHRTRRG